MFNPLRHCVCYTMLVVGFRKKPPLSLFVLVR